MSRSCSRPAMRPPSYGRRPDRFPELFLTGYPPEDLVLKPAFQRRHAARARGSPGESAVGPGPAVLVGYAGRTRRVLYNAGRACWTSGGGRCRPLQGRSAELRRLRREARVRGRAAAGPDHVPRRAPRRADLRGHLEPDDVVEMPGRNRAPRSCSSPNGSPFDATRARSSGRTSRSRASPRAACRWSISTRSAVRTSWCSTARRSCSTPTAALAVQLPRLAEARRCITQWTRTADGWRCAAGPLDRVAEGDEGRAMQPACSASATTSTRTASPACVLGLSGGIDSALVRRDGGRRAGRRARALRDAALPLTPSQRHRSTTPQACAKALGIALRHRADRSPRSRHPRRRSPISSRAAHRDITEENIQAASAARS